MQCKIKVRDTLNISFHNVLSKELMVSAYNIEDPIMSTFDIAACISPMHSGFNDTLQLVQYIEVLRHWGVKHFTAYNTGTLEPNVSVVLSHYEQLDLINMKAIHMMPFDINVEVWSHGQIAAFNDCLYAHRKSTKYLLFIDLDELIVPQKHENLSSMLQSLDNICPSNSAAFMFLHYYFCHNHSGNSIQEKILPFNRFLRNAKPHGAAVRSKLIVKPNMVDVMGIHQIHFAKNDTHQIRDREHQCVVPLSLGSTYHYRRGRSLSADRVIDKRMVHFKNVLENKITDKYKEIFP